MFFAKRRWALRVLEGAGIEASSPVATELTDMLLAGASQMQDMAKSVGGKLGHAETVLMSAAILKSNDTAIARFCGAFGVSEEQALSTFIRIHSSGYELAVTNGFPEVIDRFYKR